LDPLTGSRVSELPASYDGQTLSFKIDQSCKTIYFEIESK